MHHIALIGYGTLLVPRTPFEIGGTSAELDDVVVVHHAGASSYQARIVPSANGCGLQLGPGTSSIDDVAAELSELDAPAGWWLELDGLAIPRPRGVSLWSVPASTPWAAELTLPGGTRDEMAYLLGPFAADQPPRPEALVGPGMTVFADDTRPGARGPVRTLELAYSHQGAGFRQWRALAPLGDGRVALVSAQAALERRAPMPELVAWLAANVVCLDG